MVPWLEREIGMLSRRQYLTGFPCFLCGLLFLWVVAGCSAGIIENDGGVGVGDGCQGAGKKMLSAVGDPNREIHPGEQELLQVVLEEKCIGPVAKASVLFEIQHNPGDSTLSSDSAVTGSDGLAAVTLTAGNQTGDFHVWAHHPGDPVGVYFSIRIDGVHHQLNPVGSTTREVEVNDSLGLMVRLVETGSYEPVSGVDIGFSILEPAPGDAAITGSPDVTDQSGLASAMFHSQTTATSYLLFAEGMNEDVGKVTFSIHVRQTQECQNDGGCSQGWHCEGGKCVVDSCEPETCGSLGKECGRWEDGCGELLECGTCPQGEYCDDGVCEEECVPDTCESLHKECGSWPDGCGSTLNCGGCPNGESCVDGVCVQDCVPGTCDSLGKECGSWPDGCGNTLNCGGCPANQECDPDGICRAQLPAPTWLMAVQTGTGQVYLGWRAVSEHPGLGYNIYRANSIGGPYTEPLNGSPVNDSTNYLDTSVSSGNGVAYFYVVRLVDGGGTESSDSNEARVVTSGSPDPYLYKSYTSVGGEGSGELTFLRVGDINGDKLLDLLFHTNTCFDTDSHPEVCNIYDTYRPSGKVMYHDGAVAYQYDDASAGSNVSLHGFNSYALWDMDGDEMCELIENFELGGDAKLAIANAETGHISGQIDLPAPRAFIISFGRLTPDDTSHVIMQQGAYCSTYNNIRAYSSTLALAWSRPFQANAADNMGGAHELTVVDMDGDDLDEVIHGSTVIKQDGTVWAQTDGCQPDVVVSADIRPGIPGMELFLGHEQNGSLVQYNGRNDLFSGYDDGTPDMQWNNRYCTHTDRGWAADIDDRYDGWEIYVRCVPGATHPENGSSVGGMEFESCSEDSDCGVASAWWCRTGRCRCRTNAACNPEYECGTPGHWCTWVGNNGRRWTNWLMKSSNGSLVAGWPANGHYAHDLQEPIDWRGNNIMDVLTDNDGNRKILDGKNFTTIFPQPDPGIWWAWVVDFIGDYREEIIYVRYGTAKVFTNTAVNTRKKPSPMETRAYAIQRARSGYRTSQAGH